MPRTNETEVAKPTATSKKERKFPLEVLRNNCTKLFSVSSSTFAGATTMISDGEYTIQEMQKIIDTWLKKEVK